MPRHSGGGLGDPESAGLPLSAVQMWELVSALLDVPYMTDPDYRQHYLDQLPAEITANLTRFADARHDVHSIAFACLRHPGGVRGFVAVLREFHPDSQEMVRLEDLVEVLLPESFLEDDETAELHRLMGRVPWAQVATVYRDPVAIAGADLTAVWGDAIAVCRQLALFGEPPGEVPKVLEFADQVAHQVGGMTKAELHRWIDDVADRIGCSRKVRQLCGVSEVRSQTAGRYFLVIRLEPDGASTDMFLVGSWLEGSDGVLQRLSYDVRPRTRKELPAEVERWLGQVPRLAQSRLEDLVVEFIMPRVLIDEPVDQLPVKIGSFAAPLGLHYPVVVRSSERLRAPLTHQPWRNKWRMLRDNGHRFEERTLRWLKSPGEITTKQLHALILMNDHEVCVAMSFPPQHSPDQSDDEIIAVLDAGTPVVLWIRDRELAASFEEEFRERLPQWGLVQLPELARRLRREAVAAEAAGRHVGSVLSLLWDDADRVPDVPELVLADQPFATPTDEGNQAS